MERESHYYLWTGRSGRGLKQTENLDRASGPLERLLCHHEATINPGQRESHSRCLLPKIENLNRFLQLGTYRVEFRVRPQLTTCK